MIKFLHIVNIDCDKKTKKFNIEGMKEIEIKELITKHYIRGKNFPSRT